MESTIVYDEAGRPADKIIRFKDVTQFNSQNDELTYMAYYDLLMGLYNRNYFVRLLGEFVHRAKEEEMEPGDENVVVSHFNGDIFCIGIYHPRGNGKGRIQYKQPDFVDKVMQILGKYDIAPEEIEKLLAKRSHDKIPGEDEEFLCYQAG